MKKVLFISILVLGLIIPNINVKAVDVSNEEELRAAIKQGGDITLTDSVEVTQPLVIDKDVNISGNYIMMQSDNTLMTINRGNVTFNDISLYAGWNGEYYRGTPISDVVKDQGTALVVNDGSVNFYNILICAGKLGIEVNGGKVTGYPSINAGEETDTGYSGGKGMVVNGGTVELDELDLQLGVRSGGTALTVNNSANMTLNGHIDIHSSEENGIEVNDGSEINIVNNTHFPYVIFGAKNAIYLNGGTVNINGSIDLGSSTSGYGIYINKGINTSSKSDVLNLKNDFTFGYEEKTTPNFSIYVNPDITELKVTDEKNFLELLNNKLNLEFCSKTHGGPLSQTEEEKKAICENLNANLDGPIESNELGKCTAVYINGVKQNEEDASCNPVADNKNEPSQIVNVPATSAYASIIIIILGILCVIVSVIVTRKVTKKS